MPLLTRNTLVCVEAGLEEADADRVRGHAMQRPLGVL